MPLDDSQKAQLKTLETDLKNCLHTGDHESAVKLVKQIQCLYPEDKQSHKVLRARLWELEVALLANKNAHAAAGLEYLLNHVRRGTKIRLETLILLIVACFRQKNVERVKVLLPQVFGDVNDIQSDNSREEFLKKALVRLEEECVLSGLIGKGPGNLDIHLIHEEAIILIRTKHDDEIMVLMAQSLPENVLISLRAIREQARLKLTRSSDIKLLGNGKDSDKQEAVGSKVFNILTRVIWKSICSPQSALYKMWSKKMPEIYSATYLTTAIVTSLNQWDIGLRMLAVGLSAVAMKASAEVFCESHKPKPFVTGGSDESGKRQKKQKQ